MDKKATAEEQLIKAEKVREERLKYYRFEMEKMERKQKNDGYKGIH